jgi:hypothetical protein
LEPDRFNPGEARITHGLQDKRGEFGLGFGFPIGHSSPGLHFGGTFDTLVS